MRDWPRCVISWSSLTESSSFSSNARMRNRVGSESARRDFRVEDIFYFFSADFFIICFFLQSLTSGLLRLAEPRSESGPVIWTTRSERGRPRPLLQGDETLTLRFTASQ